MAVQSSISYALKMVGNKELACFRNHSNFIRSLNNDRKNCQSTLSSLLKTTLRSKYKIYCTICTITNYCLIEVRSLGGTTKVQYFFSYDNNVQG